MAREDGPNYNGQEESISPQGHDFDDESLDAVLNLKRVEDCRNEGRSFGTKASIILTANGVLLAIIANSFVRLEPYTAAASIGIILLSAYIAISVLRMEMDVFGIEKAWNDLCQSIRPPCVAIGDPP